MAKTTFDRFSNIMRITRKMASMVGADVFLPDYKTNFLTWFVIFAVNSYFLCTLYTIYVGFVVNGDWKIILESLSLAGGAIQGFTKLIFAIKRQEILRDMHVKLEYIYKEYQKDEEFLPILEHRIALTIRILKILLFLSLNLVGVVIFYPLIYGQFKDEKLLIMKFYLPGIDPATDTGHLVHNAFHALLIFLGGFGNFVADVYTFVVITHVPLWKDVLKIKFKKLNRVALTTHDPRRTMPMLTESLAWHQNSNIYAHQVEEAYYGVIFVQVFTSVFCISCTLFSIIIRSWPAAFVYLIYSVGMLYAYCGLGHLVEISNDDLIDIIYGDCSWYQLTTAEQKMILLMLRKSQNPVLLTVGHIMPLSMSTALQLTKAIYSYMMMLINFLEQEQI